MYTFWKRRVPYRLWSSTRRTPTCLHAPHPLQHAASSAHDTERRVFMEAAQSLALRVWKEGGADERAKMIYAFSLCTGRRPDEYEVEQLLALLRKQQAKFTGRTAAAVYVSAAEMNNLPSDVDLHKVAPWTIVARVLLNLDETITKE